MSLDSARMTVSAAFEMLGSIVAGTAEHRLADLSTTLEVESPAGRDEIAQLVDQAERMCFVMNAIQQPHQISRMTTLNGQTI